LLTKERGIMANSTKDASQTNTSDVGSSSKGSTRRRKAKKSETQEGSTGASSVSPTATSTATTPAPNTTTPKKEIRDQFRESHKAILDLIVNEVSPKENLDITAAIRVSTIALGEYVTLDWQHHEEIQKLTRVILEYSKDPTRRRPLNIIMQAEPGSGKSHFIKSLAKSMETDNVSAVTFNMASLQNVEDFIQPLEEVRNAKVVDKLPLLFLDEFDSDESNYPKLLPLLWDGELSVGQRRLRIGKVVIVLAGSGRGISAVMKNAKGMRPDSDDSSSKLPDLLSRINGGELTIPSLDEVSSNRDRRVDKVCLTVALLHQRFPSLSKIPWAFLKFVSETRFRYGVRSISHLIDLIPSHDEKKKSLTVDDLQLPLNSAKALKASSLAYHLNAEDGPAQIIDVWKSARANEVSVRISDSGSFDLVKVFRSALLRLGELKTVA
jgi:hypothetical protein